MKTRKYKQRGGSKNPYTLREKTRLRRVGFTDDQIRYLNNIKKEYGPDSLDADGIVYIIQENNNGMTPDLYTASYNKDEYPTYGDTDDEEDTDDEDDGETQQGGKKRIARKRASIRRRKSFRRTKTARKKTRKSRRRR
jgi:hypothetical protein